VPPGHATEERTISEYPPSDSSTASRLRSGFDYEATLAACAQGDRRALRALYDREARWLMGVAVRIVRNRALAEEVLQEGFLQIWKAAGTFDSARGSGRGWIYTIVRHRALQEIRRPGREISIESEDLENLADLESPDPDGPGIGTAELEHCLELLEPKKRACIVHAFVEGYTHEQIAQKLDTPLGTVKSWVRRGLLSLKECLA
jgi:RNA polymerase sigma-70 factor (ECF subfamily)